MKNRILQIIQICVHEGEKELPQIKAQMFDALLKNPEQTPAVLQELKALQQFFDMGKQIMLGTPIQKIEQPEPQIREPEPELQDLGPEDSPLPPEAPQIAEAFSLQDYLTSIVGNHSPIGVRDLQKFTQPKGFNEAQVVLALETLKDKGVVEEKGSVLMLTGKGLTVYETLANDMVF